MVTVGVTVAYGAAIGGEVLAAVALLSAGLSRRRRDREAISLGVLMSLVAGTTIVLAAVDDPRSGGPPGDWPFALASATAFVPAAWGGLLIAARHGHDDLDPAPAFVVLAVLFSANRYDSLVAAGVLDAPYVQPFAFPTFLLLATIHIAHRLGTGRERPVTPRSSPTVLRLTALEEAAVTDERHRIARDLHDSVSQTLFSTAMLAEALPGTLDRDPVTGREHAVQIRAMTLDALSNLRMALSDLRHPTTEAASLRDLLHDLGSGIGASVVVEVDVPVGPEPPPDVKLAAYRVAQEALVNASRHGLPTQIVARLDQRGGGLALSIVDDGVGFEAGAATGHHGLRIMRERAERAAAELTIESEPGHGTRVTLIWPRPRGRPTIEGAP